MPEFDIPFDIATLKADAEKLKHMAESTKNKLQRLLTLKAKSIKKCQSIKFFMLSRKIFKFKDFNYLHFLLPST